MGVKRLFAPARLAVLLLVVALAGLAPAPASPPAAAQAGLAPFLDIVPHQNGAEILIQADGLGQVAGPLYANLKIGPTGHKRGYTMAFSATLDLFAVAVAGFSPTESLSGTLSLSTTLGLESETVELRHALVEAAPSGGIPVIVSEDRRIELLLVNPGTLGADTYVVAVRSPAPPGPAPAGRRLLGGQVYSVRAPGSLLTTAKPMLLRWYLDPGMLGGASPEDLEIAAWDAGAGSWTILGGRPGGQGSYIGVATDRFGAYALLAPAEPGAKLYLPLLAR